MNPERRRSFLKGFGLFGALTAGAALGATPVVVQVKEEEKPVEDISHLAPESPTTLILQGGVKKQHQELSQGNGFYIAPTNVEYENRVAMSVGKDNRLWIQVDGKWRRVALDPWCDPTYCDPAPDF